MEFAKYYNVTKLVDDMQKKEEIDKQNKLLQQLKGRESVTKDGQKIELCANIGSVLDVGNVLKNDAEGIGLFRSEFLYLESNDYPSEDVQFAAYKDVLSKMVNKRVIVRTLDIGADRRKSGYGYSCNKNLPSKTGYIQDSASRSISCIGIR